MTIDTCPHGRDQLTSMYFPYKHSHNPMLLNKVHSGWQQTNASLIRSVPCFPVPSLSSHCAQTFGDRFKSLSINSAIDRVSLAKTGREIKRKHFFFFLGNTRTLKNICCILKRKKNFFEEAKFVTQEALQGRVRASAAANALPPPLRKQFPKERKLGRKEDPLRFPSHSGSLFSPLHHHHHQQQQQQQQQQLILRQHSPRKLVEQTGKGGEWGEDRRRHHSCGWLVLCSKFVLLLLLFLFFLPP